MQSDSWSSIECRKLCVVMPISDYLCTSVVSTTNLSKGRNGRIIKKEKKEKLKGR